MLLLLARLAVSGCPTYKLNYLINKVRHYVPHAFVFISGANHDFNAAGWTCSSEKSRALKPLRDIYRGTVVFPVLLHNSGSTILQSDTVLSHTWVM